MTDTLEDTLAHFGVKGMRWGRRKVGNFKSETRSNKAVEKADLKKDKKYLKENSGAKGFVNHQNAVADKMNPRLDALNSKPEYKGINFSINKAKQESYLKDYESSLDEVLNEVSSEIGLSPSGTRSVTLKRTGSGYDSYFEAQYNRVRHVDSDDAFLIIPKFNKLGHIIGQEIEFMDSDVIHTEDVGASEFLEHFGVKGMKWGVRNDVGHEGESAKTKTIAKLDKKYEKSFQGMGGFAKLHNAVAGEMNKRLDDLNDRFPDVDMRDPSKKSQNDAYQKAYEKTLEDSLVAATKSFGTNASGTLGVKLTRTGQGQEAWFEAKFEDLKVKHADETPPRLRIIPKFKNGRIVGQEIEFMDSDVIHAEDFGVGEFLEHFGVKGMRWGRRKASSDDGGGGFDRKRNRELNKASREADRAAYKKEAEKNKADILSARQRVYGGENKAALAAAKAQYEKDKITVGTREAKKALNKVRDKNWEDVQKSREYLDGKELAKDLLNEVAGSFLPGRVGSGLSSIIREGEVRRSIKKTNS